MSAWSVAASVLDPELPVLTIEDLGVLREVTVGDDGHVHVQITPTYSGCPALEAMRADLVDALTAEGYGTVTVEVVLSPAWTTDAISEAGRRKLEEYGVAPPAPRGTGPVPLTLSPRCPRCGSPETRELSHFGSTACTSLWSCTTCKEPFGHVKTL